MSQVDKETIEVIAQSIGINNLSSDASLFLAPDVEYRIRELMQESIKCMRHSRRTTLTCDDVDSALSLKNVEPIYGFTSGGSSLRFKRAIGYRDLFYIDDKDIDFKDVIEAPLPKAPLDTSIVCHWLAIDGVQPAIPENAPLQVIAPPVDNKGYDQKDDLPLDVRLPVKHVLSRELQLYFDKITELTLRRSDSVLFKEALKSLATDSGLHPLVPYFTYFIADEVSRGLNDFSVLFALMRVVRSLLQNPHINIEPYLHQLMPSVVSCLVAKRLGNRLADNHWELRDFSANLVALICKRFGHVYSSLQTRLTRTLLNAFLDPKKSLTQHYGAIQGLAAIGPNVVRLLLLPNLEPYLQLLEPEMLFDKQKNELKRYEAWRVYGALLRAAGQCIYGHLKVLPPLPSPEPSAVLRANRKVITAVSNKVEANIGHLQQHPTEKLETNDQGNAAPSESSASPMHSSVPPPSSDSDPNSTISNEQAPIVREPSLRRAGKQKSNNQAINKSAAVLSQAWKDDLKSRQLMLSLLELFGERIPSFIPTSEMMLFL